ncbi:DUF6624 domain-containing protein [Mucilaginibacter flavus]|uniref:DUF6624 domain-containing protein n=1 Tax=Mucilaginibacter flavus TaxID=931504 RepID=UPI0025B37CA6|nr:DUF6624 domain-containing protein [Mucilaginibacter flavus]MDN3581351.1 hypothetical protein [Mucilaginibacter flavus]
MKTLTIVIFIFACFASHCFGQKAKRDTALASQILAMYKTDQFWRVEFMKTQRKEKSNYDAETIQDNWSKADSINEVKAKAIINKYGYPGYSKVGERASDDFWAIIQHCDDDIPFQERVLALLKKEVAKNNANKEKYAYLVDRVLVNKNQKQIYGTQLSRDDKTRKFKPFPLKYPKSVDRLRKQVGLEPLAEYVNGYGQ